MIAAPTSFYEHMLWLVGNILVCTMFRYVLPGLHMTFLQRSGLLLRFGGKQLSKTPIPSGQIKREIAWSLVNCLVYGVVAYGVCLMVLNGHSSIYLDIETHGVTYAILSLPLLVAIHDAYFYFTHRLFHSRPLMRRFHFRHHTSKHTTVWATQSFHPIDCFVCSLILPLNIWLIPMHWSVVLVYINLLTVFDVYGHAGFELFSEKFQNSWFGKRLTGATHHHRHHTKVHGNFGLAFSFWDQILGTEIKDDLQREKKSQEKIAA